MKAVSISKSKGDWSAALTLCSMLAQHRIQLWDRLSGCPCTVRHIAYYRCESTLVKCKNTGDVTI